MWDKLEAEPVNAALHADAVKFPELLIIHLYAMAVPLWFIAVQSQFAPEHLLTVVLNMSRSAAGGFTVTLNGILITLPSIVLVMVRFPP